MPLFDDDDLEEYYRRIEALTLDIPGVMRLRRSHRQPPRPSAPLAAPECPTPDKTSYADENAARAAILAITMTSRTADRLRCYECRCRSWHLTSAIPRAPRRR